MADQPALPYVQAIVKETFRWFTVVPMGKLSVEQYPFPKRWGQHLMWL